MEQVPIESIGELYTCTGDEACLPASGIVSQDSASSYSLGICLVREKKFSPKSL